jgi:hypothetical protein
LRFQEFLDLECPFFVDWFREQQDLMDMVELIQNLKAPSSSLFHPCRVHERVDIRENGVGQSDPDPLFGFMHAISFGDER